MKINLVGILFLFLIPALVGCGNPKVHGKVVYSDDGSPLDRGIVNFITDDYIARGPIDKSGNYVVGSMKARDGIPSGEYKIYISDTTKVFKKRNSDVIVYKRLVDPKYENAESSGLTLNVKGSQVFNITVDRYDASKKP
ncbi:MAG: hypothetical protein LBQ54_01615 [Planctomycetaceae bacterium]|jgi:hypothetical protein|nr:hypothetical protein [Planctomycetaceae bacterium]